MAAEDGDQQYATLDRAALAGIDQYKLIKTVRVEDDGRLKLFGLVDIDDLISDNVHTGLTPSGVYKNVNVTNAGNLKSSIEEFESGVSDNSNSQLKTSAYMKTGDDTFQVPRLDAATHALNIIDYAHHEIHASSHFFVQINKDVGNGGTYAVAFTTPNTTSWLHILCGISVELEAEVILYEGVTSWTGGSAITPRNNNRNSATASGVVDMVFDPTVTLGSPTILCTKVLGSGKDFGAMNRSENELILKQNTKYYILITNQATGASNEINIDLEYYEHTNRTA